MGSTVEVSGYLDTQVKGPSAAFAILFTISGIVHIAQNSKYKSWPFLWLIPVTSLIFTAGFICREYNAYYPHNDSTFTASQGLLFSGVPIITGTLYIFLSRLLGTQPHLSPLRPTLVCIVLNSLTFAVILSLTAQGTSSFFNPTASHDSIRAGLAILKSSLILQLFLNITSIGILVVFHLRCSAASVFHAIGNRKTKITVFTLYALATVVFARNIFRTVQIFSPFHSAAWKTEAFFWVFDAALMLIFTTVLNVVHPGKFLLIQGDGCEGNVGRGQGRLGVCAEGLNDFRSTLVSARS